MISTVIVFPGSNCDRDVATALTKLQFKNQMVWHKETKLPKSDLIVVPGGFSYGDYLRSGAIAGKSLIINEVIKAGKPVIVDFWAERCGPCKQIGPILEEISSEMSEVVIAKHNIDNEPNTPTKYGVRGIPTMLLFSGGELKATKVGATTKSNIVSWIKENI